MKEEEEDKKKEKEKNCKILLQQDGMPPHFVVVFRYLLY